MRILNNENSEICTGCGGKCCKNMPGIASPEDFGAPDRERLRVRLQEAFASGRWTIDHWHGDPREGCDEYEQVYYVRPATVGSFSRFDAFGGGRCTFLTDSGCEFSWADRPTQCRALVPSDRLKRDCVPSLEYGKRNMATMWIPYQDILTGENDE